MRRNVSAIKAFGIAPQISFPQHGRAQKAAVRRPQWARSPLLPNRLMFALSIPLRRLGNTEDQLHYDIFGPRVRFGETG